MKSLAERKLEEMAKKIFYPLKRRRERRT